MVVLVRACKYWTDTGLDVDASAVYEFRCEGRWLDWCVTTDAKGYDAVWFGQRMLNRSLRLKTAPWFALCGEVRGDGRGPFFIGSTTRLQIPAGRLMCFANDVRGFYWNNRGELTLTIRRVE